MTTSGFTEQTISIFNPAFLSLIIAQSTDGYYHEIKSELPILQCYLILPMVLHSRTRKHLPGSIRSSMGSWTEQNPSVVAELADRLTAGKDLVNTAIIFGCTNSILELDKRTFKIKSGKFSKLTPKFASSLTSECREILQTAKFAGRWFAHAGSSETIYSMWGITV